MMRNCKSLINLNVIGSADGTNLGRLRDLIFDSNTNQVLALVVSEKDLFGWIGATVVAWDQIESIGQDVVLVRSAASVQPLSGNSHLQELAETHRSTALSGTKILTADGKELGTLADLVIDEATGQVTGYKVSEGVISDTLHGKKFLPGSTDFTVGQDVAVVPATTELEARPKSV